MVRIEENICHVKSVLTHYIKYERPRLTTCPNTERRAENTTRSGAFLTIFEMFGNLVKHDLSCLKR